MCHDALLGWVAKEPFSGGFAAVEEAVASLLDKRRGNDSTYARYTPPVAVDAVYDSWDRREVLKSELSQATDAFRDAWVALIDSGELNRHGVAAMLDVSLETVEAHLRQGRAG